VRQSGKGLVLVLREAMELGPLRIRHEGHEAMRADLLRRGRGPAPPVPCGGGCARIGFLSVHEPAGWVAATPSRPRPGRQRGWGSEDPR
jgi:hypothetical protein